MFKKTCSSSAVLLVLISLLSGVTEAAKTLVIQDGLTLGGGVYAGTESTWLSSSAADTNFGSNGICRAGYQGGGTSVFRSLIRFRQLSYRDSIDLGIHPHGILSAKLILTTDSGFAGSGSCELRVVDQSEVDPNDVGWTQGNATWNNKDGSSTIPWVGGPGLGSNFGTVIDTVNWTAGGPTDTQMEFVLTGTALELVRNWVSGDNQWFQSNLSGSLILVATDESGAGDNHIDFYSEDNVTDPNFNPILEITYVPTETIQIQEGLTIAGEVYGEQNGGTESAWYNSGNPFWTGGGSNAIMRVGYQFDEQFQFLSTFRTLIRFGELSHFAGVEPYQDLGFPAGAIVGARLRVWTDFQFDGSGRSELRLIDPNDENWAESFSSWNKKRTDLVPQQNWAGGPGLGSLFGGIVDTLDWGPETPRDLNIVHADLDPNNPALPDPNSNAFYDLNTSEAMAVVRGWITGDNTSGSFLLKAEVEDAIADPNHNWLDFHSENANEANHPKAERPMLEITYVPTQMLEIQNGLQVAGGVYDGTETAWVNSGDPLTNLGLNGIMRVGFQFPDGGFQSTYRSLIRFGQLSHFASVDLGIDVNTLVAARLVLTLDDSFVGDAFVQLRDLDPNDQDWTEAFCTWNKKRLNFPSLPDLDWGGGPGFENTIGRIIDTERSKTAQANAQKVFDLDDTALEVVKGWITGDNTSGTFALMSDDELGDPNSNDYIDFYSEQTSSSSLLKPKLQLFYYTDGPTTCAEIKQFGLLMKADFDENCLVDLADFTLLYQQWLKCIDPQNQNCQ